MVSALALFAYFSPSCPFHPFHTLAFQRTLKELLLTRKYRHLERGAPSPGAVNVKRLAPPTMSVCQRNLIRESCSESIEKDAVVLGTFHHPISPPSLLFALFSLFNLST